jgi:hypothetical protein
VVWGRIDSVLWLGWKENIDSLVLRKSLGKRKLEKSRDRQVEYSKFIVTG